MERGLAWFALAMVLLAGCTSRTSPKTDQATLDPTDETGVISGTVTDTEVRPITAATLGIRGTDKTAKTDVSGAYALAGLAPGTYTVDVARIGFIATASTAVVKAGQVTALDFKLDPFRTRNASYPVVTKFNGYYECALGTAAWVSPCSWPYTAIDLTLKDNNVNLSTYGVPSDLQDNRFRYVFPVGENATEVVSELVWTKSSAASEKMLLIVGCDEYDPVADDCGDLVDGGPEYARVDGTSPLRIKWKAERIPVRPDFAMARAYLPGELRPSVAFAQEFTIWNSVFYGGDAPEGYSVLNKK